ncbi:MAG: XdhC family protein [Saprospiraceae bacterium]|nr:XdhC family protein [Saprospiraceae bacterium]
MDQHGEMYGDMFFLANNTALKKRAADVLENGKSEWLDFTFNDEEMTVFLEFVPPVITLVIAGAGNDVKPLVDMADVLGWETKIIDGRPNYARKDRFPKACDVILAKPQQVLENISVDNYTCFILMTHNYNYDKALLYELCKKNVRYIAMLGPKKKLERMVLEFEEEGRPLTNDEISLVYSPAGLDIGAETSEEIALSILAEIKAIMSHKKGNHLRQKLNTIHA